MATPENVPDLGKLVSEPPDNDYFPDGHDLISWVTTTKDGIEMTYGHVLPGFEAEIEADARGELITLDELEGGGELHIKELDEDGHTVQDHVLRGKDQVQIPGSTKIRVSTPQTQKGVTYICEYRRE